MSLTPLVYLPRGRAPSSQRVLEGHLARLGSALPLSNGVEEVPDIEFDLVLEGVVDEVGPSEVFRYPTSQFVLRLAVRLVLPRLHHGPKQHIAQADARRELGVVSENAVHRPRLPEHL